MVGFGATAQGGGGSRHRVRRAADVDRRAARGERQRRKSPVLQPGQRQGQVRGRLRRPVVRDDRRQARRGRHHVVRRSELRAVRRRHAHRRREGVHPAARPGALLRRPTPTARWATSASRTRASCTPFAPTGLGATCTGERDCDSGTCAIERRRQQVHAWPARVGDDDDVSRRASTASTRGGAGACWPPSRRRRLLRRERHAARRRCCSASRSSGSSGAAAGAERYG